MLRTSSPGGAGWKIPHVHGDDGVAQLYLGGYVQVVTEPAAPGGSLMTLPSQVAGFQGREGQRGCGMGTGGLGAAYGWAG